MQRKLLGLFLLLAALGPAACRPSFSAPQHEAELALQLSKRNSTGCIEVLYSRKNGFDPDITRKISIQHPGTKATGLAAFSGVLEWKYLGSSLDLDIYEVKYQETIGGKLAKPVKKRLVRFNGKDPVVVWDDSRYILVRPLSEEMKQGILNDKYGVPMTLNRKDQL